MKKYRGKLLSLVGVLLLIVITTTGCGNQSGGKMVYLNFNSNEVFGGQIIRDAVLNSAKSKGINDIEVFDAKGDANLQIDQMKKVLSEGAEAIVLVPANDSIIPFVEQANEAGIPIVTVNRTLNGGKFSNVYSDDYEAGKLQADYLIKTLPQGANIVYLHGESSAVAAHKRFEGFKKECLDKRTDIKLLDVQDGKWSRAEGMKIVSIWLSLFPKIDAVVCGNDDMALGAIIALKAANRFAGCQVTGVDAMDEALQAVAAGEMVQTIKQDAEKQGEGVATNLDIIRKGGTPSDIIVPYTSITKENIAQFKK
jgi:inositol transport system substrate-binding protein